MPDTPAPNPTPPPTPPSKAPAPVQFIRTSTTPGKPSANPPTFKSATSVAAFNPAKAPAPVNFTRISTTQQFLKGKHLLFQRTSTIPGRTAPLPRPPVSEEEFIEFTSTQRAPPNRAPAPTRPLSEEEFVEFTSIDRSPAGGPPRAIRSELEPPRPTVPRGPPRPTPPVEDQPERFKVFMVAHAQYPMGVSWKGTPEVTAEFIGTRSEINAIKKSLVRYLKANFITRKEVVGEVDSEPTSATSSRFISLGVFFNNKRHTAETNRLLSSLRREL